MIGLLRRAMLIACRGYQRKVCIARRNAQRAGLDGNLERPFLALPWRQGALDR